MGANTSKQTIQQSTEILTNSINNFLYTNDNNIDINTEQLQTITLKDVTLIGFKNVVLTQKATLDLQVVQQNSNDIAQSVANDCMNDILNTIDSSTSQTNQGLNLLQFNTADVNASISNYVQTNLENSIEVALSSSISINASQEQVVSFDNVVIIADSDAWNSEFVINQETVMNIMASQIVNNLFQGIMENTTANQITNDAAIKVDQTNTGIMGLGILLILVVVYFLFKTGSNILTSKKFWVAVIVILIFIAVLMVSRQKNKNKI
jgi:hypothetical protein